MLAKAKSESGGINGESLASSIGVIGSMKYQSKVMANRREEAA
jgi:hypothetical protein